MSFRLIHNIKNKVSQSEPMEVMITFLFGKRAPPVRRSIENPNTPLSFPDDWLGEAWGGGESAAGITVGVEKSLTYSPVWRAVNLIARDVAKLPLVVYRRMGDGKERDPKHPAYFLMKHKPNPEMTFFQFRMFLQAQALLRGNGYARIERIQSRLVALWPLESSKVEPKRIGQDLFYIHKNDAGLEKKYDNSEILHIKGLGDGIEGKSVISKARESLGLGLAAQKYGAVFFKNSATPSAVLEHPGKMTPEAHAQLRRSWEEIHVNPDNKHRMAILEEGMKLNPFGISNEDAQFLETRQFEIREVANWFGVPPHKLGDTTRTAFASLEQENQAYLDDALDPWLVNWEAECWDKLFLGEEKSQDTHIIEFTRAALLRADMAGRSTFYASALQNGWMNRDEIRSRENLNPIPEGEGQKFFVPKNMGLTGEELEESPDVPDASPVVPEQPARIRHIDDPIIDEPSWYEKEIKTSQRPQEATGVEKAAGIASQGPSSGLPISVLPPNQQMPMEHSYAPKHIGLPYRALLCDLISRLTKRITGQAARRAKNPDRFMDWIEGPLDEENRRTILESCVPVMTVLAAVGEKKTATQLADLFFASAKEAFLTACETIPKDLEASVTKTCERMQATFPSLIAEKFLVDLKE